MGHSLNDRSQFFLPQAGRMVDMPSEAKARFGIGDIVRHRRFDFRGVIFDIDPVFANSEEWYEAIPEALRPSREQPYYHIFAENDDSAYIAYVSQQNLVSDAEGGPVAHPEVYELFGGMSDGRYQIRNARPH